MMFAFDRVVILDRAGGRETYSAKQFLELPLDRRIKHILSRDIEFFRGHAKVEQADALESLRRAGLSRNAP